MSYDQFRSEEQANKASGSELVTVGEAGNELVEAASIKVNDAEEKIRSYIAEGDSFEGDLILQAGARISGCVKGKVKSASGTIIVEETGSVLGGIEAAGRVVIAGQVGQREKTEEMLAVRTPSTLLAVGSSRIYGAFEYGRLAIYDDATLEGMGKKIHS